MTQPYSKITLLLVWIALSCACCKPEPCETTVPTIKYKTFIQFNDSSGKLIISFEDCDGNMGLKEEDSLPPYDYNLFLDYFEMQDGQWVKFEVCDSSMTPPCIPTPFYYRIPYIEPEGQHKKLEGEIEVDMAAYFNPFSEHHDSIKFEIKLVDRALQESNTISTPMLIVPK